MAPGAALHFYTSTDLYSAIQKALSDNTVDIFSLSFGACELDFTSSDNATINGWWKQAAGQGIAVTVSTGDSGSAGCDATTDSSGNSVTDAVDGLAVNAFASTPYNIAVGGSDMDGLNNGFSTYVSTSQGDSATFFRTALKYIPESTWNDSTETDTTISANVPNTGSNANIVGGGGGKSSCSTNTDTTSATGTCTSGYTKPAWQRGTGVPSDGVRDLPDVSLMAGNGFDPATWLICTDDTGQNGSGVTVTANCTTQSDGSFYFLGFGGTSTAAPAFAGVLALVEQKTGGRLGQAAVELYDLYNGSHGTSVFHDITVGNNSVPCTSGTSNCTKNSAGYYYESGYDTTAGYDLATGLGSVDANQLVTYWGTGVGATAPTVKVMPGASSILSSQSLSVVVDVTGSAVSGSGSTVTPTGTVTLTSGNYTSSAGTLSGGAYTFAVPAGSLSVGTDTLTVKYSGDANFASGTGTGSVTVTAPVASVSPASLTFASTVLGASAATQAVTVKNTGTASLSITNVAISGTDASSFSETNTCASAIAVNATCTITVKFTPAATGTLTASLGITDNAVTSSATVSLTGTGASQAPIATFSPSTLTFASTTIGTSDATTQPVTLKNSGTAAMTISSVSVTGTNASSFSQTNDCGTGLAVGVSCTITVKFTPASIGALSASISVADNAGGSPQSVALTGTGAEPTNGSFTLAATAVSVAPGASGSSTITATGTNGYVGASTVTLSACTLTGSPTGASDLPTCSITGATVTFEAGASTGSGGTVSFSTTAASNAVRKAQLDQRNSVRRWTGAGGFVLAGILLIGIPARNRKWRSILGVFAFLAILGFASGCGGGSSTPSNPGTTAGSYTFQVTGTDTLGNTTKATITLTVS
jgi:hypothetical protein